MKGNGQVESFGGADAFFMGVSDSEKSVIEKDREAKAAKAAAAKAFNEAQAAQEKRVKEQTDKEIEEGRKWQEKADSMEIVPCNNYVLVRPYEKNPFEKLDVTDSGIVLAKGDAMIKNPNTGEMEREVNLSVQADVIEVGPMCNYVKEGDIVYYRRACGVPIPFFRQGFEVVAEPQIQVVLNEGLKARFAKLNKNGK